MENFQEKRGFTLVESLISIAILIAAIAGAATAIQVGISSYIFSKNQIIAFYLAQEGFEQIRNMRDENGLKDQDWLTGISANVSDPCYFGNACIADSIESTLTVCGAGPGNCPVLRQSDTSGYYGYEPAWSPSIFRREIQITEINDDEISILVTVDWYKGSTNRQFRARENILNWYP